MQDLTPICNVLCYQLQKLLFFLEVYQSEEDGGDAASEEVEPIVVDDTEPGKFADVLRHDEWIEEDIPLRIAAYQAPAYPEQQPEHQYYNRRPAAVSHYR